MTEWWLRKAVICHLSPIFCNYYFVQNGITMSSLTRSVGSVTSPYFSPFFYLFIFQLTRSVGSVTLHIVYVKSHHHNRADILLKITLKSDIFYIICIIFSANLHIKPISLHVRSQNQTTLRVIRFLCTYMLHSPLPIITQIIESKAILFFINNFHKSIF